jgi:hypothetical protein
LGMEPLRKKGRAAHHVTVAPFVAADGVVAATWVVIHGEAKKRLSDVRDVVGALIRPRLIMGEKAASVTREIMREHFLPSLVDYRKYRGRTQSDRMMIVLDGHRSRYVPSMLKACKDANIDVIVLPAHSTHILQPIDVALARRMKKGTKVRAQYTSNGDRAGTAHTLAVLSAIVPSVQKALTTDYIKGAWATSALWPFDFSRMDSRNQASPQWGEILRQFHPGMTDTSRRAILSPYLCDPDHDYSGSRALSYGGDILTESRHLNMLAAHFEGKQEREAKREARRRKRAKGRPRNPSTTVSHEPPRPLDLSGKIFSDPDFDTKARIGSDVREDESSAGVWVTIPAGSPRPRRVCRLCSKRICVQHMFHCTARKQYMLM